MPDSDGFVQSGETKIHYEVYGEGSPTILLMPTWTIVHKRFWKGQIPYLARHHRVVTYDGPGNGRSDRPLDTEPYHHDAQVGYALAVLDATGTDRAVVVGLSKASNWALQLAAQHADRVLGTVVVGPGVGAPGTRRSEWDSYFAVETPEPAVAPSLVPLGGKDPLSDWAKYNLAYWRTHHEDFMWFFMGRCFSEEHSTKQIEDGVEWGLNTTGEVLVADYHASRPSAATVASWCERLRAPILIIHGEDDHVIPLAVGERLAEVTGGEMVVLAGGGHIPMARDPVKVNLLIHEFAVRVAGSPARPAPDSAVRRTWRRWNHRPRRVLYLSSPIGLGHARRDLAIARELRQRVDGLEIDWLTQHPVTAMLEREGEHVHPGSRWLANESAHVESESAEHDLHCFQALRRMDEILVANFMVFHDVIADGAYDLVVGDEAWDVDHFLHENPELKRCSFAWMTDFVGYLPMPDGGDREALVAADYNAEMIEHIARFPRIRDRAVFVGDPDDIVDDRFGPDLPLIRDWTLSHYDFAGYVTGFDPDALADRDALRAELGYHPDERVCVVSVGGSGVGTHLLRRVVESFPEAARRVPGLRMVVVTGPRIDPASLAGAVVPGGALEVRAYVPDLHRHLAACDLAVVQGGLTTCMELTATGRPFIYVPLRHHFEQNFHVAHRLRRHGAGRRLDYDDLTPDSLAEAIAQEIGRDVSYRSVASDGAARAAALLADLL